MSEVEKFMTLFVNIYDCYIYLYRPKFDEGKDPGAGLMDMMKQMYDDGDDEMKRTIAKAWHDSQEKRASGDML